MGRIRDLEKTHPGSRGQKSTGSRIRILDDNTLPESVCRAEEHHQPVAPAAGGCEGAWQPPQKVLVPVAAPPLLSLPPDPGSNHKMRREKTVLPSCLTFFCSFSLFHNSKLLHNFNL